MPKQPADQLANFSTASHGLPLENSGPVSSFAAASLGEATVEDQNANQCAHQSTHADNRDQNCDTQTRASMGITSEECVDLPFGTLHLDERRVILRCSEVFKKMAGFSPVGQILDSLIARADRPGQADYLRKLSSYQEGFLDTFVCIDTVHRPKLCRLRMRRGADQGWLVIVEELQSDDPIRKLLQAREDFRNVIRSATEGIAFFDDQGQVLEHNSKLLEICAFRSRHGVLLSDASIKMKRFSSIAPPQFAPIVDALAAKNISDRKYESFLRLDDKIIHVLLIPTAINRSVFVGCILYVKDVTVEEELNQLQLEHARSAGRAEIATGVLHNVGNVMNSVNVAASLLQGQLRENLVDRLEATVDLLSQHQDNLSGFFAEDARSQHILPYLGQLAERAKDALDEVDQLIGNVTHVNSVIAAQQSFATMSGVEVETGIETIVKDAIQITNDAYCRASVKVIEDFDSLPEITIDKNRILQVLVNLFQNALHAIEDFNPDDRTVSAKTYATEDYYVIEIKDTGIGISADNLARIFSHGFSTRTDRGGHGFGLHHSCCLLKELGGELKATSDGIGTGATFRMELPKPQTGERTASPQSARPNSGSPDKNAPATPVVGRESCTRGEGR